MIQSIFNQFEHKSKYVSHKTLEAGHINDTYLIETVEKPLYVLQKINHDVFPNVPELIENKVITTNFLRQKYSKEEALRKVLTFIPTTNQKYYYLDMDGGYWNLMIFLDKTQSFESIPNSKIAYEGGKLFGDFIDRTSSFDTSKLHIVIPQFHDLKHRLVQFENSISNGISSRIQQAHQWIETIRSEKDEILKLQELKNSGAIPLRLTHNDTKISNALFDLKGNGLCVIDLDTIMPGIIHYDFGDAIRTMCNTAKEDEKDLSKVALNLEYFKAFVQGFAEKTKNNITRIEIETLVLGAKYITLIQGVRILTDYINGDVYYKTAYENHNLIRAQNQLQFLGKLKSQTENLNETVHHYYNLKYL